LIMISHFRIAARKLAKAPGFGLTATLTLALGIGLSVAVFTVADALLLRRLPVFDQDRLVTLWGERPDGSFPNYPLTIAQVRDFTRGTRAAEAVAYFAYEGATPVAVREEGDIVRMRRALVSGNWFDVLGSRPVLGRALQPSDDIVGAFPVAVISDEMWTRHFGRDPNVVGRRFNLFEFNTTYSVAGVMPPGLEYPRGVDFWAPFVPARLKSEGDTTAYTALDLVVRLAPGATIDFAEQELTDYFGRTGTSAWTRELRGSAQSLTAAILGDTRAAVLAFALAVVLLLFITCLNVANLLLVRSLSRVREIAVRSALGASRRQLVSQLLAENALLAIAGGVAGIGVAYVAVRGFLAFAPASVPMLGTIHLNGVALVGATAITAIALLLFGLAPALAASGAGVPEMLRAGSRPTGSRNAGLIREGLVAAQVALAVLVLSAAALVGRSFMKLQGAELAFDPSRVLVAEVAIAYDRYPDAPQQLDAIRRLLDGLAAAPGVQAVSPVVAVPFSGSSGWDGRFTIDGQSSEEAARNPMSNMELVTPAYFDTFGLPVLRGRAFSESDRPGSERVVMISESFARRYWNIEEAPGKRVRLGPHTLTVVGIVPDTRYRDLRIVRATVYFPLAQSFFPFAPTTLAIRTIAPPEDLVPTVRRAMAEVPGLTLEHAAPFERHLAGPLAQPRLNAFLLSLFAAAAAALAAIGLFGVMSTMVQQRTRELGIRVALGATAGEVVRIIVGRGLTIGAAGIAVGIVGALAANRLLSSLLYEVSPGDAVSLVGVAVLLALVALVATFIPARSSARLDPAITLRADV
jgi:predicted permease